MVTRESLVRSTSGCMTGSVASTRPRSAPIVKKRKHLTVNWRECSACSLMPSAAQVTGLCEPLENRNVVRAEPGEVRVRGRLARPLLIPAQDLHDDAHPSARLGVYLVATGRQDHAQGSKAAGSRQPTSC